MKSVMISIKPKWCKLIASGEKTIEVRKTKPSIDTPFKCYIYETKGKRQRFSSVGYKHEGKSRIIGEFVCDKVYQYSTGNIGGVDISDKEMTEGSCLTKDELSSYEYSAQAKDFCVYLMGLYGWHISDLVIYNKPRELSEFYTKCDNGCENCDCWKSIRVNSEEFDMDCSSDIYGYKPLTRPPQSWCYVTERS